MISKDCHENQAILLSHATECLAKAATALAEAAEAVAAAAKSFIPYTTSFSTPQSPEPMEANTRINAIVDYESDSDSSLTSESLGTTTKSTNNIRVGLDKDDNPSSGVEKNSIPNTDPNFHDDKEDLDVQSTTQGIQSSDNIGTHHQNIVKPAVPTEVTTESPPPSHCILLDNEADVLLVVCCLIRQGRKVICYVRSSIPVLEVYGLFLNVTGVPIHNIKSSSSQELERAAELFRRDPSSVLLLPATHSESPKVRMSDLWVIHIGWPTNEQLYKQQIINHQAKNNVFVACSKDKDLYPSSNGILMHAQEWPQDDPLFVNACKILRPLFAKRLSGIPAKTKARIYPDWIYLHGSRGPYHPPSWTPSILVRRANLYLLDVLKYTSSSTGMEVKLPEVSPEFVSHHKLESAVEEGVLQLKSNSGINHISSLPHAGAIPAGSMSLNELDTSRPSSSLASVRLSGYMGVHGSNSPSLINAPPRSVSRISSITDTEGKRPSNWQGNAPVMPRVTEYLIIEQDFDVIPSICHLSTQHNFKNVICFVKSLSTFGPLVGMLEKMVTKPVFLVKGNWVLPDIAKQALDSSSGCLLLCDMYTDRPITLKNVPISWTIHLGWVDNIPVYRNQIQHSGSTVVLIRREVQTPPNGPELLASLGRAGVSPASTATKRRYNRQTGDSILTPGRKQWQELLPSSTSVQAVRQAYLAWITHHFHGRHKEPEWTAVNVATNANKYFRGLFRCGNDGGVLQERPTVSQGFVKHLGLEAAVAEGLLTVKE